MYVCHDNSNHTKDMSTEAAEIEKEEEVNQPAFVIELEDTEAEAAKASVLEAHKGKAETELAKEIEAALAERLKVKQAEVAPVLAKMEELSKDEANKGKTEEELMKLAAEALAEGSEEESEDTDLDERLFGKKPAAATPTGDSPTNTASKVDLPDEVKQKVAKYEAIEKDPVYNALLKAKESNAEIDLVDLIVNAGLTNNPEKIQDPVFFKRLELEHMQKEDPSITNEEVDEFLAEFKEKSKIAQWNEVKGIKEAMTSEYRKAKSLFATKVASGVEASKDQLKEVVAEAEKELRSYPENRFFGVELTEAHRQKAISAISTGTVIVRGKDGKVDAAKSLEAALLLETKYDSSKAYYQMGLKDAERKAQLRSANPLRGVKVRSSQPRTQVLDRKARLEKAKQAHYKS